MLAAEDAGATVRWVDIREEDATLDLASFEAALSERTKVVAFTLASNAVGTITPAAELTRLVHERTPAIVACDGVHLAQHRRIDVRAIGADLVVCSPYKIFGPHLGILFGRREVLSSLRPYKVRPAEDALPFAFETGTQNHEGFAGWVAAVEYLAGLGEGEGRRAAVADAFERAIVPWEAGLSDRFLDGIREIASVRLYGIADPGRVGRAHAHVRDPGGRPTSRRDREDARRARDLRLGRQLLRARDHGAARAAGLGRGGPDRVLPLQHAGRGGPGARGARDPGVARGIPGGARSRC